MAATGATAISPSNPEPDDAVPALRALPAAARPEVDDADDGGA
ncbi:MAG TPA: hypothetical protein VLZ05_15405 [Mycobacterium sp.]|nr:hypothetical protein [Mycobacterium sp.]HUH70114.1 hypothetical protein [Mycobacterium sp.]